MILVYILKIVGWILALFPESFCHLICKIVGDLIYYLPSKRKYTALSNLHHAFPEKPLEWHHNIARECLRRLIELTMFVLVSPWLNEKKLKSCLTISSETLDQIAHLTKEGSGGIALTPHFTLMETLPLVPLVLDNPPRLGAIFRPFENKYLNNWVKDTRERFGFELFSRKDGLTKTLSLIRDNGWLSILYDQNAGNSGALITLFGRVASATDLPGIIAKKFNARTIIIYSHRLGFWKSELKLQQLNCDPEPISVTVASNAWLENHLSISDDQCSDWLWSHKRWKNQDTPRHRLRLLQKKNYISEAGEYHNYKSIPKKTRFWIRMPNWLGDVVMALPLLRTLRTSRPDAEITLLIKNEFVQLLEKLNVADSFIALPPKKSGYYKFFKKLKTKYPDTFILFTNSYRGDMEAYLTKTPQRFGMLRPGKSRPLLTHNWQVPTDIDEAKIHQTDVWEKFLRHFGLHGDINYQPFENDTKKNPHNKIIGLICGSENNPEKRWPQKNWADLINKILVESSDVKIHLFGTKTDQLIVDEIIKKISSDRIENFVGNTTLEQFADEICKCQLIVCNDSGGMHLANAMGIPLVALFGPTNPIRTRPIFESKKIIIQPDDCKDIGGSLINKIKAEMVFEIIREFI